MLARCRRLTVIGGFCVLLVAVSCSVEITPEGVEITIGDDLFTLSFGANGLTISVRANETTEREAVAFRVFDETPTETPSSGSMVLRSTDVSVGRILTAKYMVRAQSAPLTGTATATFYVAPGETASCSGATFLAEYDMTLTAGVLSIAEEVYDLTSAALEIIAVNDVTICVEVTADFDGEITFFDFSFAFGSAADDARTGGGTTPSSGGTFQVPINVFGDAVNPTATYSGVAYAVVGVLDVNSSTLSPASLDSNVTQFLGVVDVDLDDLGLQYVEQIYFASAAAWVPDVASGTVIATLTCDYAEGGTPTTLDFTVGSNTAEWSHERIEHVEDGGVPHAQAPVLYSSQTTVGSRAEYTGHMYSGSASLDTSRTLSSLTLELNDTGVIAAARTWGIYPEPTWAGQTLPAITLVGQAGTPGGGDDNGDTGGTGTASGHVVDAQTGVALAGVLIEVTGTGLSGTTDAGGGFTISDVPEGGQTLTASLTGYVETTVPIVVFAGSLAETSIGMLAIGAGGDNIAAVLAWGERPYDLDLHMSGPDGEGGTFHAYYSNKTPVAHVFLDLDDTSSFGPETMTVSPDEGGTYVPGDYHVWIHNYSGSPAFSTSAATVTLFAGGSQLSQYSVGSAGGDSEMNIWLIVQFTVLEDGSVSNISVQQSFTEGSASSIF